MRKGSGKFSSGANKARHYDILPFMGQIVIDIPTKAKRRYVLTDKARTAELLAELDQSALRVNGEPSKLTQQQIEDLKDLRDAKKAMAEYRRTGISYTIGELREKFGLV